MKKNKIRIKGTIALKALIIGVLVVFASCASSKTNYNNSQTDYVAPKGISENNPYRTHHHKDNLYDTQSNSMFDDMVNNPKTYNPSTNNPQANNPQTNNAKTHKKENN